MFTVTLLLSLGVLMGVLLRRKDSFLKWAERLSTAAVFGLLFLLGISVGRNPMIRENLGVLGLRSVVIALGASAGSVLLAWGLFAAAKRYSKDREEVR